MTGVGGVPNTENKETPMEFTDTDQKRWRVQLNTDTGENEWTEVTIEKKVRPRTKGCEAH